LTFTLILLSAIISSVCEELIYRGYLINNRLSIIIQALLWSLLHVFNGYIFFLWTIVIGILLGILGYKYGILPCIIAHMISNLTRLLISTIPF
ncbi:MAG: CPBP family intramembrane glutamic endopeptidase, partial [Sulfolobaceae archaeon]